MDAQVKAAIEDLSKTVAEFKAANDKRIAEIEAKGQADPLTAGQVEKLNKAIDGANDNIKTLQQQVKDVETAASRPGLGGNGDPKAAESLRKNALAFRAVVSDGKQRTVGDAEIEEYKQYSDNFSTYLRALPNSRIGLDIQNSMSIGAGPEGGFWAPTEYVQQIITRLFETSPMRQVCDVISTTAQDIEFPDDGNTGVSGGWMADTGTVNDTDTPPVGFKKIFTHAQYAQPKVTQQFLDDAAIDVAAWLSGKTADIIGRTENAAFVSGTGTGQPRGFLSYGAAATTSDDKDRTWGVMQYVPTGGAGGFPLLSGAALASDADCLVNLVHKLKAAYRSGAVFLMNRGTFGTIRTLKDNFGNYLWRQGLEAGKPDSLLGYPVIEAQDMPDAASNSLSVAFGNFKEGYRIVDRAGLMVLRDPFTGKPFVKFYFTKRVGGDVTNYDAIKLLKFAAS